MFVLFTTIEVVSMFLSTISCIMPRKDIVVSTREVCVLVRLVGWSRDSELGWPWHRPAHFPSVPR